MRHIVLAASLAGSFCFLTATPTLAFGGGCSGQAVACYDKVRVPDVYATETRSVLLRPAYRTIVPTPPLIRNYAVPVVMRPGRWHTVVAPPVYGMQRERVVVAPAQRVYEEVPAVTRRVTRTVVVPASVRWERTRFLGRERLYKIATPATRRTVEREIVVSPARRITHVRPAVYGLVERPVVVRPPMARQVYEPPVHGYINRSVVVRPAGLVAFSHPPVVGVTREHVLIRPGGYAWVRSRSGTADRW